MGPGGMEWPYLLEGATEPMGPGGVEWPYIAQNTEDELTNIPIGFMVIG